MNHPSHSSARVTALSDQPAHALRLDDAACPFCEQRIPHDRLEEVQRRISSKRRDWTTELTDRFAVEKNEALRTARLEAEAAIEESRQAAEARVAQARLEERHAIEASAVERISALTRTHEDALAAFSLKEQELERQKSAAKEQAENNQAQLDEMKHLKLDAEQKVENFIAEAAEKERLIREEAMATARMVANEEVAESLRLQREAAADLDEQLRFSKQATESSKRIEKDLQAQLLRQQKETAEAISQVRAEAEAILNTTREAAVAAAESDFLLRTEALNAHTLDLEEKLLGLENAAAAKQASFEMELGERLKEQRAILEADKLAALNVERSATFIEKNKLSEKVEELQRAIAKKTAEELGEGAEVDLYESLKERFSEDYIQRIAKGLPGADIIHHVKVNGREIGRIIYDSKDHNAWRNDFVTKLAQDQLAADASHAVLSTRKFPAGVHQVEIRDGVIVAHPARVVALVDIIRNHMVTVDALRIGNKLRANKTDQLYSFITSERFAEIFGRIDRYANDLLDLQIVEKRNHDNHWKKEGQLLRETQKSHAELQRSIDEILGIAGAVHGAV